MVIFVIQRRKRWGNRIDVLPCKPEDAFEEFLKINEAMHRIRDRVDVTLQHIREDQIQDWIDNNIDPNWYETLMGRITYSLWVRE